MNELDFGVELRWTGTGGDGIGELRGEDAALDISVPEAMGGRGVGTNPEELLVSAVSSCFSATLFAVLRRAGLPADSIAVQAHGVVAGFPRESRFDRLVVSPTVLGGDSSRQDEYERAAVRAHDRCLVGNALSPEVAYEVGAVRVRGELTPERVTS
jgi:peroxiredoxin-like protein